MLNHKPITGSLKFDPLQWLSIPLLNPEILPNLQGKSRDMYALGQRILSITDHSELEFNDLSGEPFVMIFKRGSLVAYGDGNVCYHDDDVIADNPDR